MGQAEILCLDVDGGRLLYRYFSDGSKVSVRRDSSRGPSVQLGEFTSLSEAIIATEMVAYVAFVAHRRWLDCDATSEQRSVFQSLCNEAEPTVKLID